jgi:hypothetical protein
MAEWVGTWMGRRLVGPGIGVHRRMLVGVVVRAAGSGCDIGMLVAVAGGYMGHIDWDGCDCQTGGDSSPHGPHSGPSSGPGDCSPERRRIAAGDAQSGAHSAVHRSPVYTPEAHPAALVALLAGTVAFASLAPCERRGVKGRPSLWGLIVMISVIHFLCLDRPSSECTPGR